MPRPRMFRLGKTGLARVLGDLEAKMMEVLWASENALSVQNVCESLGANSNYKTVMTVLNRLVNKELLEREIEGRAYFYRPRIDKATFLKSMSDDVVKGLIQDYGDIAVASFIDAVEVVSPESLAKLGQLLRERQSQSSQDNQTNETE